MTRFLLALWCIIGIWACKAGIPKEIMPPEQIEKVLFDIHLIDGYVMGIHNADSAKKVSAPIYQGIFKKYGIDSAAHAKNMQYYYHHPELLSKIYEKIGHRLNQERDQALKQQQSKNQTKPIEPVQ